MSDDADFVTDQLERELQRDIDAARGIVPDLPGDAVCSQCGGENDRASAGFAVCSVCWSANMRSLGRLQ